MHLVPPTISFFLTEFLDSFLYLNIKRAIKNTVESKII